MEKNLTTKRPGTGISAMFFLDTLGGEAQHDHGEDEVIL